MAALKRNTTPPASNQANAHPLVGRRIVAVRGAGTDVALVLDDGSILVASRDEECNGPGVLLRKHRPLPTSLDVQIVLAHVE